MNISDLHSALMAQAETLEAEWTVLWPRHGGKKPSKTHLRINHVTPNPIRTTLDHDGPFLRTGALRVMLVEPLGEHEVMSKANAQKIIDHFPLGPLPACPDILILNGYDQQGEQIDGMWETPIWVTYQSVF